MKTQNKSESYQIEKGVPIPVFACRKFPLNEMEPGESFSLSAKEVKNAKHAKRKVHNSQVRECLPLLAHQVITAVLTMQ